MNPKTAMDDLIEQAAKANINEELPKEINLDGEWVKFKEKYLPRRNYYFVKKSIAIIIPVLFCVGILLSLLFPVQAKAISLKSLEFFKSFIIGKVQTVGINYANKDSAGKDINSLSPDIIEKIQSVPFEILLPVDYLNEYHINSFTAEELGDSTDVSIKLATDDNRKVDIQQINITKGFSQGLSFDNEDAVLKRIRINGQEATLVAYKKQLVSLSWIDGEVFISMDGNISEDEIIQLGSNMRRVP
ncbi:DUF4367 domain-containing protein [Pelotomaculum terephthalicicum JT]|uniref:DUF4367 domain-containing protein n=1 Tax=Pelotomaculum TaxID=191373 RepID=UPI0009CEAB24|nr:MULTISPECIES: DUF4367 domain-containing protein [Pelotomaculum]MCG9969778.1 DUF4367 domain-containing protein [Pelotomaculum terephthalicicum JT]OPX84788.1 MAG: hypothetical protein A4E54_02781 [Pelotomaculum sp. PtaB.Bin117]OPY62155.1 MAG: hypothetical protein A4E56_01500 [Pelotomaculum sp. PtaU1.Bin065]